MKKIEHVDTMRGLAILMVILVHTAQSVPSASEGLDAISAYGQLGVQLFFIASSFTLSNSWFGRQNESNKIVSYGVRRFFRIAPIYYLGILLYFFVSVLESYYKRGVFTPGEQYSIENIFMNMVFLHGLFPPANNGVVPGGWSIGTEVMFYLIFPVLFSALIKLKNINFTKAIIVFSVSLLSSQALLLAIYLASGYLATNNSFLYFNIITQLPVFILGMIYFFLDRDGRWPAKTVISNLIGMLFFFILTAILWSSNMPAFFSVIPTIAGISFLFLFKLLELRSELNLAIVRRIGVVSYSMYIFHFVPVRASRLLSPKLEQYLGGDLTLLILFISSVILTFSVALLSERYVETFFIRLGKKVVYSIPRHKPAMTR